MKAVTYAAAGAALIGSVSAGHARLHRRETTWADWESTTTKKEVDPAKKTTTTWDDWSATTTTKKEWDPSKETTTTTAWEDWSATTTTSKEWDPSKQTTTTVAWEDWSSTTTTSKEWDPSKETTTTVAWEDWNTEDDPSKKTTTTTTTGWEDWATTTTTKSKKVWDPKKTTTTETWGDWSSVADPTVTATVTGWEDWGTSTTTLFGTVTKYVTVAPTGGWATTTSQDWATSTTEADTVYTSSVAPGWSSDGWFGGAWPTGDPCVMNVVTSYGAPTWYPVAAASPTTTSTWADWDPSTTKNAVTTTSTTWADWDPSTTTSTSTTWADWDPSKKATTTTTTTTGWEDWATASATPTSSWKSRDATTPFTTNGNIWGITYTPYDANSQCKTADVIASDLAQIKAKGFTTVRVYSTDCNTLQNVGAAARAQGLKLVLGVWIAADTGVAGAWNQINAIIAWAQWDLVELIVVGNESVFSGFVSAGDLVSLISGASGSFKGAGYTGPITTTEPLNIWQESGASFCGVVDVVAANLYAFFNAGVVPSGAGAFIQSELDILAAICPGKGTYAMESGWPSAGDCNGSACPGVDAQATAIQSIKSVTGSKIIFFTAFDDEWKQGGAFNVEQHFGCLNAF